MVRRPYLALIICVVYALSDEGHQVFVPGRTASLYDLALASLPLLDGRIRKRIRLERGRLPHGCDETPSPMGRGLG